MHRHFRLRVRRGFEFPDITRHRSVEGLESVIVKGCCAQAAKIGLYGVIGRCVSSSSKKRGHSRDEVRVCGDLDIELSRSGTDLVFGASPDGRVIGCCVAGSNPQEGDARIRGRHLSD